MPNEREAGEPRRSRGSFATVRILLAVRPQVFINSVGLDPVRLNSQPVTGPQELFSGDRIDVRLDDRMRTFYFQGDDETIRVQPGKPLPLRQLNGTPPRSALKKATNTPTTGPSRKRDRTPGHGQGPPAAGRPSGSPRSSPQSKKAAGPKRGAAPPPPPPLPPAGGIVARAREAAPPGPSVERARPAPAPAASQPTMRAAFVPDASQLQAMRAGRDSGRRCY